MGCGSSVARPADGKVAASAQAPAKPTEAPSPRPAASPPSSASSPAKGSRPSSPNPSRGGSGTSRTKAPVPGAPGPQPVPVPVPAPVPQPSGASFSAAATATAAARSDSATGAGRGAPPASAPPPPADGKDIEPQSEVRDRARDLTSILAERLQQQQRLLDAEREEEAEAEAAELLLLREPSSARSSVARAQQQQQRLPGGGGGGEGGGGLGEEVETLLGTGAAHYEDLLRDLMATHTQVLLPGDVNPEDAATLQAVSGCSTDQAVRLLDCLAVVRAAADALAPPPPADSDWTDPGGGGGAEAPGSAGTAAPAPGAEAPPVAAAAASSAAAAATGPSASPRSGPGMSPSPQQLTRQLGALAGLVNDVPGLRTAAMARDAAASLLRILLRHEERAAAANAALVLAALAAGPPPHKASLIAAGVVEGLLQAATGRTAAAEAKGGDAAGVAANACSALGNLATGHAGGAAAVAAGSGGGTVAGGGAAAGIEAMVALLAIDNPPNVRTNAAGVLVQLTGAHESHRAAVAAAGGVPALAAGMLRGPDAPACNSVTALYNLAALSPPSLRPAMAQAVGPLAIVPQLLLCMSGRNAAGAPDESVAASSSARVNASAVLLEMCKDPRAAPQLAEPPLAVPAALAALAAGRLPPASPAAPAPAAAAAGEAGCGGDILAGGVDLLYPVPAVVRGNCLLGLMALARMGPAMQLELGRCGALGTLLELLAPGQDPAMQVNSANALCSLAAANSDIHSALVAARCVPLLAGLLAKGGDAARANVAAVFVTMMRDGDARQQMQECGALTSLVRLGVALLDERMAAGASGGSVSADPGGVVCNTVGALAEAAKYPDLRRALMQVEFGESLVVLLRCLKEGPEPAQVNAAAALCHLCREHSAAVQLGRLRGVELLKEAVGAHPEEGAPPGSGSWTRPSSRLRHNASRALLRLQEQLAAAEEEEQAAAAARAVGRASAAAAAAAAVVVDGDEAAAPPAAALGGSIHARIDGDGDGAAGGVGGSGRRTPPPRAVWDFTTDATAAAAAAAAAAAPAGTSSKVFDEVMSYDDAHDDVDDLSTVITPPLPLAAF